MSDNKYIKAFWVFYNALTSFLPDFNIKYKGQSTLMKIIGWLMFFNKDFMTKYTTTLGKTVYFADKSVIDEATNYGPVVILGHEYVHAKDAGSIPKCIWFVLAYLFPQILAPFMLLFCLIYWWLGLALFILFLLPLPAPGRMHYELRGYLVNMFLANEIQKSYGRSEDVRREMLIEKAEFINESFCSSAYYFMWPFGVKKQLQKAIDEILAEEFAQRDEVYREILEAYKNSIS